MQDLVSELQRNPPYVVGFQQQQQQQAAPPQYGGYGGGSLQPPVSAGPGAYGGRYSPQPGYGGAAAAAGPAEPATPLSPTGSTGNGFVGNLVPAIPSSIPELESLSCVLGRGNSCRVFDWLLGCLCVCIGVCVLYSPSASVAYPVRRGCKSSATATPSLLSSMSRSALSRHCRRLPAISTTTLSAWPVSVFGIVGMEGLRTPHGCADVFFFFCMLHPGKNLEYEPRLTAAKQRLAEQHELLAEKRRTFDELMAKQQEMTKVRRRAKGEERKRRSPRACLSMQAFSPDAILMQLQVAAREAEEEAETLSMTFQDGDMDVDAFLDQFMKKRTVGGGGRGE